MRHPLLGLPLRSFLVLGASLVLCGAALVPVQGGQDQKIASEKEKKIRRLLAATNAGDMGKQAMDGMLATFRNMPGLPAGFIEKFQEVAKPEELVELIIPIYAKHLDDKTLDATIAFYDSPEGKKFAAVQPKMMQESMAVGQKWGEGLSQKVLRELDEQKKK